MLQCDCLFVSLPKFWNLSFFQLPSVTFPGLPNEDPIPCWMALVRGWPLLQCWTGLTSRNCVKDTQICPRRPSSLWVSPSQIVLFNTAFPPSHFMFWVITVFPAICWELRHHFSTNPPNASGRIEEINNLLDLSAISHAVNIHFKAINKFRTLLCLLSPRGKALFCCN